MTEDRLILVIEGETFRFFYRGQNVYTTTNPDHSQAFSEGWAEADAERAIGRDPIATLFNIEEDA